MKAQSAIEFLSIVALGIILLVGTSFVGYNYVRNYFFDTNSLNARQMVSITTSASNLLYSQGVNASTKVKINMPYDITRNRTYFYNNEINLRFGDPPRDSLDFAATDMYGTIPLKTGTNVLYLKMTTEGVKVKVDDNVSFIDLRTYNNTARTSQYKDDEFVQGETVYYRVITENFTGSAINPDLEINVYYPNATFNSSVSVTASGGKYDGTVTAYAPSGYWLISAYVANEKILGTALFRVN